MRLERLEIGGFMNFDAPAVLDLRDVPAGLVAITGENGQGKTRLLDAGLGAVYGEFPSRGGNMADYATSRAAYVDALFAVDGKGTYRTRFNVDGVKGTRDAVLEQIQPDGTSVALNDGKVSTHREAVAAVFPPMGLVLASAFAAQNKAGSFVALDRAKRKDLFAVLLGLDRYATMAAAARACFDRVERERIRLTERRAGLLRVVTPEAQDAIAAEANRLQIVLGQVEIRRAELQAQIEGLAAEADELAEQAAYHARQLERQRECDQVIGACDNALALHDAALAAAVRQHDVDLEAAERERVARWERAHASVTTAQAAADVNRAELQERIDNNRALAARADEIRAAVAAKAEALQQIDLLRAAADHEQQKREEALVQVGERERRLRVAEKAEAALADARRQAGLMGSVPCRGGSMVIPNTFGDYTVDAGVCQFLADARAAGERIPQLEADAAGIDALRSGIEVWQDTAAKHAETLKAKRIAIAQVEQRLRGLELLVLQAEHLAATEARIAGYERELAMVGSALGSIADAAEQERLQANAARKDAGDRLAARLAERRAAHAADVERLTAERGAAEQERAIIAKGLPETAHAASRLAAAEAELSTARAAWAENEAAAAVALSQAETLKARRLDYEAQGNELRRVGEQLRVVENRGLVWQTYTRAFGRDGLPTLEIAAAGPTVSALTNQLLEACFGTRFTVELVTQEAKADGKGLKETFELKVFDNEHGGDPRDLADLSGGERVIVEEALRAALAVYVNSRNVAPMRTCWRDETTGALDPENATRYVAMLRKLHELGGFQHIVFVTHNLDAAALADTQIVVTDGQPVQRRAA